MARARSRKRRNRWLIRFYDEFGEIKIDVPSAEGRSFIAKYHNAVRRYLEQRDLAALRPFRGQGVRDAEGRRWPFITNPRILDRLARAGALFGFEDIYSLSS